MYSVIGIFYKDKNWARNVFYKIKDSMMMLKCFSHTVIYNEKEMYCNIEGLVIIKAIKVDDSFKGFRVDKAIVQGDIDEDIFEQFIRPLIKPKVIRLFPVDFRCQ